MNSFHRWLLAGLVCLTPCFSRAETNRFNILFCFADDWGRYARAYAKLENAHSLNEIIQTPNVNRLAREGVLFRNAFVPAPSCTPCRSSLLSGRYWWNTGRGAILQGAVWDASIPSFPLLLRDAGYHIGKSYKVWSPGTPADAPFGAQRYGYEKSGRAPNNFSEEATRMIGQGMSLTEAREKIHGQVKGNFDSFLADRKDGQPWLYWFGATTTHRTWIKGSGKKLWNIDPDSLKGKMHAFLPDVPQVREDVADYLGEVQAFDSYIGVLLKRLEETGELDRTIILVSGDHGMPGVPGGKCNLYDFGTAVPLVARWPGATGGRVVEDFVNLMDLAPTFMEIGGVRIPPRVDGRSILAQLKSPAGGQVDPTRSYVVTGRERHVGAAREGNLPYPMRAIRTKDFLYVRNFAPDRWPMGAPFAVSETNQPTAEELETNTRIAFPDMDAGPTKAWLVANRKATAGKVFYERAFTRRPGEELYDLRRDPAQTNNLAGVSALQTEMTGMSNRLMKVLQESGDPRVIGSGSKFDQSPFTDPEQIGQRPRPAP